MDVSVNNSFNYELNKKNMYNIQNWNRGISSRIKEDKIFNKKLNTGIFA